MELIGKKNLKLLAIENLGNGKLNCICDCGNYRVVGAHHFKAGCYKSCGCHFRKDPNQKPIKLTQEELMKRFRYDPETGDFTRLKVFGNSAKIGSIAGSKTVNTRKPYLRISIDNKFYPCHRLVWLYMYGHFPENEIDHLDGNGTNNKLQNLRHVLHRDNGKNIRLKKNNKSGYCGVYWDKRRKVWISQIKDKGRNNYLGSFRSLTEAVIARKKAEVKYGFHENHGSNRPL